MQVNKETRVNSQVTFNRTVNRAISIEAANRGVTRSQLINSTMAKTLKVRPAAPAKAKRK